MKTYSNSLNDYKPTIVRVVQNSDGNRYYWNEEKKYTKDDKEYVQWSPALANDLSQISLSGLLFTHKQAEHELKFLVKELKKVVG